MRRRHGRDLPLWRAGGRTLFFILSLLGVLMTQASRAQEAAPAPSDGTDVGPIDTRITVQPSRTTKPVQDISGAKTKGGIATRLPGQQTARQPGDGTTPNAIGLPVVTRGLPQVGPGTPPPVTQPATAPAYPHPPANSGMVGATSKFGPPAVANRATISGTGMTHPGTGVGRVQGMPKSLGTVSGTNLFQSPGSFTATALVQDLGGSEVTLSNSIAVSSDVVINGTGLDDTLTISRTAGGPVGSVTFILDGGTPVVLTGVTSFTFNGLGGNDTMTVSLASGGPLVSGNVVFDGGPGSDGIVHVFDAKIQQETTAVKHIAYNGQVHPPNHEGVRFRQHFKIRVLE